MRVPDVPVDGEATVIRRGVRPWIMAALGCVLASALLLGGGARFVMRVTAMIADPQFLGDTTTGGNTVGRITFLGSVGLVWLGALGGLPPPSSI